MYVVVEGRFKGVAAARAHVEKKNEIERVCIQVHVLRDRIIMGKQNIVNKCRHRRANHSHFFSNSLHTLVRLLRVFEHFSGCTQKCLGFIIPLFQQSQNRQMTRKKKENQMYVGAKHGKGKGDVPWPQSHKEEKQLAGMFVFNAFPRNAYASRGKKKKGHKGNLIKINAKKASVWCAVNCSRWTG